MKKNDDHNEESTINDEALMLFFDAKDAGKSFPDALLVSGLNDLDADIVELRVLWDLHGNLIREAHTISPSGSLLGSIIEAIPDNVSPIVTTSVPSGYPSESRRSMFISIIYNLDEMLQQMNWKVVAPIAVFVLVVVAVVSGAGSKRPAKLAVDEAGVPQKALVDVSSVGQNSPEAGVPEAGVVPTEGTPQGLSIAKSDPVAPAVITSASLPGAIDEFAASITLDAGKDATLLSDGDADIALVGADSQFINDFTTAYDETTF